VRPDCEQRQGLRGHRYMVATRTMCKPAARKCLGAASVVALVGSMIAVTPARRR